MGSPRLDVDRFLEDLSGRYARAYAEAVQDLLVQMARKNRSALEAARKRLAKVIAETMGVGEVLGASLVLRSAASEVNDLVAVSEFQAMQTPSGYTVLAVKANLVAFANTATQTILPRVTFTEAVEDMVERTPTTIRDAARRTAENIARLYGEGSGGVARVAFVRSAEQAVTERVQGFIAEAIKEGISEVDFANTAAKKLRAMSADWAESYARMAFRTNLNTSVTAGRFRQAQDPDIKAVIPAFRFDAVMDGDTRDNHGAADGLIMSVDNPDWRRISPPLGYNCRCQVSLVGRPEMRRRGRLNADGSVKEDQVPSGAFPDPGFRHGGRPDLLITGAR